MPAKRTSKNQIAPPKANVQSMGEADHHNASPERGRAVLTPGRLPQGDAVCGKLKALGIAQSDVGDTTAWARRWA